MIGVLVIFALVVTATSGTNVLEYSEDAVELVRAYSSPISTPATFLNPGTTITLQRRQDYSINVVTLVPESSSNGASSSTQRATGQPDCEGDHGIHLRTIPEPKTACRIAEINMITGTTSRGSVPVNTFHFSILFQQNTSEPLRVDIPVLQLPNSIPVRRKEYLEFADAHKVSPYTPFIVSVLMDIMAGRRISFSFHWLNHLLKLGGVFKLANFGSSDSPPPIPTYVTRPLVLPGVLTTAYFGVVENIDNRIVENIDNTDEGIQKLIEDIDKMFVEDMDLYQ